MKKLTLAERFAKTSAAARRPKGGEKRLRRRQLEQLAPVAADAATLAYETAARRVAARMRRAIKEHLESPSALSADELERKLLVIAGSMRKASDTAAKRVSNHARKEMERMLIVKLPNDEAVERGLRDLFVTHAGGYYAKLARELAEDVRAGKDPRDKALARMVLIAKDQAWKLEGACVQNWAVRAGGNYYYWVTCRDERVRPGHARLDMQLCSWAEPPDTGEGRYHPGGAIHCRCRAVPKEAAEMLR